LSGLNVNWNEATLTVELAKKPAQTPPPAENSAEARNRHRMERIYR
jgi:hypothetical protein